MIKPNVSAPHVLVLPGWFESKWNNNACGTFFREQAHIMQELAGWEIRIIYPSSLHICRIIKRGKLPYAKGVEVVMYDGIETWFGYYPHFLPRGIARGAVKCGEELFSQYIEKYGKPDFLWVQSMAHYSGHLARHLNKKYGIPYFLHEHFSGIGRYPSRSSTRHCLDEITKNAVYCAAVSNRFKRDIQYYIPEVINKISVIHNPVGLIFANTTPAPRRQNSFIFVSTCNLGKVKNVTNIILAFAEISAEEKNTKLIIVGDGNLKEPLMQLVVELDLSETVVFTGHQPRKKVCEYLLSANAFVAVSDYESFGVALAEALSCGLPVISTDVGIAGEVVNDINGVLIDKPSVKCIADAMRKLMSSSYDSTTIQQTVREIFSPNIFARRVQENLSLLPTKTPQMEIKQ